MTNLILAIVIIAAAFIGTSNSANRGVTLGALGVIGAILVFVSATAAQANDFGPVLGVGAFVATLGLFWLFNCKRG